MSNARPGDRSPSARAVLLAAAVGACLAAAGCAALGVGVGGDDARSRFHRLWEAGRYPSALAVYDRDSTLRRDPGVLYRVALARLQPAEDDGGDPSAPADPEGAARALGRLVELEPEGARAVEARTLLRLLETLGRVRTQLQQLKEIDLGEEGGGS